MADVDYYTKPQRLVSEIGHANTSKFFSQFLYKAVIVTLFLVILPLFPSQAPEFINQTVFTRSWELLHLLFVGIAVSYGLFSRRTNDETSEKETASKFDNAQSYVSRLLQVSSVFDDEADSATGSDETNKIQTWSSQYYRNEPVVVVAQESSVLDEQRGVSSRIGEKPLLLPVRSLKSRVSDSGVVEFSSGDSGTCGSLSRSSSNSGSRRFSNNSNQAKNGEFGGFDRVDFEEKMEGNVVLPSPIPWRSRSGKMEMKEEVDSPPLYNLPPSMQESEYNLLESRSFRAQSSRLSRPNSTSSSPNNLSPSASLSSESQAMNGEDLARKKNLYNKSCPPPAPPLPPPMRRGSPIVKSNSNLTIIDGGPSEKDFRRSFSNGPNELSRSGRQDQYRRVYSATEARSRAQFDSGAPVGKSVRTARVGESFAGATKAREGVENGMHGKVEKRMKEAEATLVEKAGRKRVACDQSSFRTEKPSHESVPVMSKPTFSEFQKEEIKEFFERESDDDSENEDAGVDRSLNDEEGDSTAVSDGGPDVDKKADEFIAKFREQIRLQRIESIKRSTGQIRRNSST